MYDDCTNLGCYVIISISISNIEENSNIVLISDRILTVIGLPLNSSQLFSDRGGNIVLTIIADH